MHLGKITRILPAPLLPVALFISGCAAGPNFVPPAPPDVSGYAERALPAQTAAPKDGLRLPPSGGTKIHAGDAHPSLAEAQRFSQGKLPVLWWKLFGNPQMDVLVERALRVSPNLEQARAALARARELWRAEAGAVWAPAVDISASATPRQINAAAMGSPETMARQSPFTVYAAGLSVGYTFDFFGGGRRKLEALAAEISFRSYELEAARLTLISGVLLCCVREAGIRALIDSTEEMLETRSRQLKVETDKLQAGGVSMAELAIRNRELAELAATLPPLERALAASRNQLAVLVGASPATAELPRFFLRDFALPGEIPLILPGELVRQRPDIKAAEALLHKATAQVGAAAAQLYPSLNLTGGAGYSSTSHTGIFLDSASVWNVGLSLLQPVFRGGELLARKRAAEAEMDMALAAWKETALRGYADVANALAALESGAKTLAATREAAREADKSRAIARRQYALGGISLLEFLDADRKYHEMTLGRIQAEMDRLAQTVALFQALGGSWKNE